MESLGTQSERFVIGRKLGSGGSGVIYLAHDRLRGTDIALKVLRQVTGPSLYRFKREFRGLADIAHPNLVSLYELHNAGHEWFFTMEYVEGTSFLDWVRPPVGRPGVDDGTLLPEPNGRFPEEPTTPTAVQLSPFDSAAQRPRLVGERFAESFYQLVDGVHALHSVGKLHRDLKPSNVRVDKQGRVVLLDFGLSGEIETLSAELTHDSSAVGTPLYMSPEQAADEPLSEASDWYSVGVMLHEALTGVRPISGMASEVMRRKQVEDVRSPRELDASIPEPLARLCQALLARDPRARPDGLTVLAALGRAPSQATQALIASRRTPFAGRKSELAALDAALAETRATGRAVAVLVSAPSGTGKTALVRRFVDRVADDGEAVVLEGRCFERETLPHQGLDAIVDDLTRFLVRKSDAELVDLLPRDVQALARLFPVLLRVPAIAEPAVKWFAPPDPQELRRRAFSGLRRLLSAIGARHPLVVWLDDVQWSDTDGATMLAELMHHPEPPAMLLVLGCRSDEEAGSPVLTALRRRSSLPSGGAPLTTLTLGALEAADAAELAERLRGEPVTPDELAALLAETGASTLFLSEALRAAPAPAGTGAEGVPARGLEALIAARVEALPDHARRLLEAAATAGRPAPVALLLRVAALPGEGNAIWLLERERLARSRGSGRARTLEAYHDRVRTAVLARLDDEARRALHRRLAAALAIEPAPDAEALARHHHAAGDLAEARRWLFAAAAAAQATFAFHRAAQLYQDALAGGDLDAAERRHWTVQLAHALANAGRPDDAAEAFARAAEGTSGDERLELRRLQLEQVLGGGHLEAGLALSREVLGQVGLTLPSGPRRALLSIATSRTWLRLRGLGFKEKAAEDIDPSRLRMLDACWSCSSGLSFVDPLTGKALQMRYLRSALAVGEPERVVKALFLELGYRGLGGLRQWSALETIAGRALDISRRLGKPHLEGLSVGTSGLAAYLCGRYEIALGRLRDGERLLRDHAVGFRWEMDVIEFYIGACLLVLGRVKELVHLVPVFLREAEDRGDLYAQKGLLSWRTNAVWWLLDRPDEAAALVERVSPPRPPGVPFTLQDFYAMLARAQIALYRGDAEAAARVVEGEWRGLERSLLLGIQSVYIEGWHLRGRVALMRAAELAAGDRGRDALAAQAVAAAKRLTRAPEPGAQAMAQLLVAGAAAVRGDAANARAALSAAAAACAGAGLGLYATCARLVLGQRDADAAGLAEADAVLTWMRGEGIVRPERVVAALLPGFAVG